MSKPGSKKSAKKRLREIEHFKHTKKAFDLDVGKVDISASAQSLEVDAKKDKQVNRINVDTDAYKAFLKKGLNDSQDGAEDGIGDYDRFLIGRKRQLKNMKKRDHFHDYPVEKGFHSNGFVAHGYGVWLKR